MHKGVNCFVTNLLIVIYGIVIPVIIPYNLCNEYYSGGAYEQRMVFHKL
jgi:hypothetical protein